MPGALTSVPVAQNRYSCTASDHGPVGRRQPVTTANDSAALAAARKWHVLLHPAMLTSHQTSIDKMVGTSERGLVKSDDHRSSPRISRG